MKRRAGERRRYRLVYLPVIRGGSIRFIYLRMRKTTRGIKVRRSLTGSDAKKKKEPRDYYSSG